MLQSYFCSSEIMSLMWALKSRCCSLDRIAGFVVTPLGKPRFRHCSSSSRLAVSTNSFMRHPSLGGSSRWAVGSREEVHRLLSYFFPSSALLPPYCLLPTAYCL